MKGFCRSILIRYILPKRLNNLNADCINFYFEDIKKFFIKEVLYREWIFEIIGSEGFSPGFLNFIFTSDEYLLKINKNYLGHDYYTDVIAFDYTKQNDQELSGDVFISIERVRENSEIYRQNFDFELRRVIAHGVLHLLGYGDSTVEEKKIMKEKENMYLDKF